MALEDAKRQIDHAFTRDDLKGLSFELTFAGAPSFLRRRYTKDVRDADLVITGVPFDQAVTNRPGTRLGPRAIREASALQSPDAPFGWDFDPWSDFAVADAGDMAFDYAHTPSFPGLLTDHIGGLLVQGPGVVTLGGDHSITLPILRAYHARFGPLAVVQFDAHSDLWADDDPARIDHGTFLYKAVNEGLIDVAHSIQIGIRTDCPDYLGIRYLSAREVHESTPKEIARTVRDHVGEARCYLTFDIDALDPAFAPGTGTPVWGGLASWQAAAILRDLAGLNLVGGDVVEVSPPFDPAGVTAVAAAHVAVELCCLYLWNKREL